MIRTVVFMLLISISVGAMGQETPPRTQVNRAMMVNFLKSLILPGWGQWSNGQKVKASAFLLAEIGTIAGYKINYDQADLEEKEFKVYANEHWSYGRWLDNNGWDVEETACGNLRTHEMRTLLNSDGSQILDEDGYPVPLKDHHFYENISKYPEFICGWDDIADQYKEGEGDYTPNKRVYIDMRTHSNELFKNAQVAGTLIFANHLISALDAAFGTDITSFETTNYSGNVYINPLNTTSSIKLEVKF